jgi:LAO/AO transport system kinase
LNVEIFSPAAIKHIQKFRKLQPSAEVVTGILSGSITALSRAITLIEVQTLTIWKEPMK